MPLKGQGQSVQLPAAAATHVRPTVALLQGGVPGQALPEPPCGPAGGARREGHVAGDAGGGLTPHAGRCLWAGRRARRDGADPGCPPDARTRPLSCEKPQGGLGRSLCGRGCHAGRGLRATKPRAADPGQACVWARRPHPLVRAGSRPDPAEPAGPPQGRWTRARRRCHLLWAHLPLPPSHGPVCPPGLGGRAHTQEKRRPPPSWCFPSQTLPGELLWAEPRKMAGPGGTPRGTP